MVLKGNKEYSRNSDDRRSEGGAVRQPKQDRSIAMKERIVEAGFRLFSVKGYHNTNSKEIVRDAGTGIGTFYDYFTDKKDLFLEILRRHREEFLKYLVIPEMPRKPTALQLRKIVGIFIDFVSSYHENAPAFHKEAVLLRHSDPDIETIMNEWDEANRKAVMDLYASLSPRIRLKDPEAASYLIVRIIEDAIHFIHLSKTAVDKRRLQKELIDCVYMYIFGR